MLSAMIKQQQQFVPVAVMPVPYTPMMRWGFVNTQQNIPPCAAVIDIEALLLKNIVLVEQIGFLIRNNTGVELFGKRYIIEQPLSQREIEERYQLDHYTVMKAIEGYQKVTGDDYVHPKSRETYTWTEACNDIDGNMA